MRSLGTGQLLLHAAELFFCWYTSHSGESADAYRYCAANSNKIGSSRKCPNPRLQWPQSNPRTCPVMWSWSTTKIPSAPQITHCVTVFFKSFKSLSEIFLRCAPRQISFLYEARQFRHQLSSPLRFLLWGGNASKVAGFSILQRVQVNISIFLTPS